MSRYSVGYLVGSLASDSINRTLSKALIRLAPPRLELTEIPIGELPLYSRDYDGDYPPAGRALKDALAAVDAVLFVTPEYNRSIPGALKNAIDWASRPRRVRARRDDCPRPAQEGVPWPSAASGQGVCSFDHIASPNAVTHLCHRARDGAEGAGAVSGDRFLRMSAA